MSKAIVDRQTREKSLLIEQLKKIPIVQVACEKVGVGRATFYRWRKDDEDFSEKINQAISEGNALVNDMAESQLMSAIKNNRNVILMHDLRATRIEDQVIVPEANAPLSDQIFFRAPGSDFFCYGRCIGWSHELAFFDVYPSA